MKKSSGQWLWGLWLGALAPCVSLGCFASPVDCEPGTDGCPCTAEQQCLGALVCVDQRCEGAASESSHPTASGEGMLSSSGGGTTLSEGSTSSSQVSEGTTLGVVMEAEASTAEPSRTSEGESSEITGGTEQVVGSSTGEGEGESSGGGASTSAETWPGSSSTGHEPLCGNGTLDPEESCDGGVGCSECVLDGFACNPLNNGGCEDDTQCTYMGGGRFACLARESSLEEGEMCTAYDTGNQCAAGLGCFGEGCPLGYGFCCLTWCDAVGDQAPCESGSCRRFWVEPNTYLGLEWLGFCVQDSS